MFPFDRALFSFPTLCRENDCGFMPATDIVENKNDILITLQLPGMEQKDIRVLVEKGILTVSGERKLDRDDNNATFVHREIATGSFERAFKLADSINPKAIEANYKNGLLTIKLTKKEEVKPKEIEVKIS